ncbi:glutathione S-transferase [Oleomonas cavernae]|uniref:Glutathione S-transferase n=1 Tax=Oleomonas cavernae TaxID=2320859 RepID=A0A418WD42_9PROT|nr:glutathione S-transferase [Oleomonas cavernae]RJF87914.1 glutathione S-transferase [Oleomonas cavernae]
MSRATAPYVVYGAPPSLYTGKTRSYMRKMGLPYVERLPSDPAYAERVMPAVGKLWLPVLEAPDGTLVQDTTQIIDYLEACEPVASCYPAGPRQLVAALLIELYGDEGLTRQAMHFRWSFPDYNGRFMAMNIGRLFSPTASEDEARAVAAGTMRHLAGYLPAIGVTPETIPVVEAQYFDLLAVLDAHFLHHPYLFGGRPSIGDFGLMGPLYAHLGRDPYPAMLMAKHADRVQRWVERMNAQEIDSPEFPGLAPAFLAGDEIPQSLQALLALVARDYLPELQQSVAMLNDWLTVNAVEEGAPIVPPGTRNTLGTIAPVIRGVPHPQRMRHYPLWMLQRVTDAYDRLAAPDRQAVDALFAGVGLGDLPRLRTTRRIERRNHQEVWGAPVESR